MTVLDIGGRKVGSQQPVWIVAELGAAAARSWGEAEELVRAAAEAGADVVKGQCFTADDMTIPGVCRLTWQGVERDLHDLYREAAMPMERHALLKQLAESLGMTYFCSVFDQTGIDLMVRLGVPCLKVASFELTDLSLIRACWETGLPLILSTGMATAEEMEAPLDTIIDDYRRMAFLRCTSAYPAGVQDARLGWFRNNVNWLTCGLSDHSRSNAVVSAAVTLGACIVERHLCLDRSLGGPDAAFSDEPAEFAAMVRAIRETEAALGAIHYGPTPSEEPMLRFRRSLWVTRDVAAGEALTHENVRSLRPTGGLEPKHLPDVLGKRAKSALARGTALDWKVVE